MKKVTLELKEGDHVVHATHGVGRITGIDRKKLEGEKLNEFKRVARIIMDGLKMAPPDDPEIMELTADWESVFRK